MSDTKSQKKPPSPPLPRAETTATHTAFTLDDKTGMAIPSVTRLLNRIDVQRALRRKRGQSTQVIERPAAPSEAVEEIIELPESTEPVVEWLAPPETEATGAKTPEICSSPPQPAAVEIEISSTSGLFDLQQVAPRPTPAAPALPAIQPAKRMRERKAGPALVAWKREALLQSKDPIARAAALLLPAGATDLLFLARSPLAKGDRFAVVATAALTESAHFTACWSGLRWAPDVVPKLWEELITGGAVELSPPGEKSLPSSERNVVRSAFGAGPEDWITLLRTGTPEQSRGILVVISRAGLLAKAREALPLLAAEIAPSSRAA